MRYLSFLYALSLVALTGCQDAIGPGGDCAREMRTVRNTETGTPIVTEDGVGGDFVQIWRYPHVVFTFRWGRSYDGCEVDTGPLDSMLMRIG